MLVVTEINNRRCFSHDIRVPCNFLCMHSDILSNCEVNGLKLEGSSRPVSSSWGSLDSFNGTKVISKTVSKTDSNYRLMNAGQGRIYTFPGPKREILFLFIHK